jgi:3-oxoacyl-[acyl-carrier protein] reductase
VKATRSKRTSSVPGRPPTAGQTPAGKPLIGMTAIVTGSGKNIGKAIALALAEAGANVVVNGSRDRAALDRVVAEIERLGAKGLAVLADVGKPADVRRMVKLAEKRFGGVDIAISNAAVRRKQAFLDISVDAWKDTLNTNLNSAFYLAQAVLPGMAAKRFGRIIHISGVDGFAAHVNERAHNIVSKAGIHGLTKALAKEFGPRGITVNTVAPGAIETERDWSHYMAPAAWRRMRRRQIPLGRIGRVEEIAAACVYLAADGGSFVSGQVIHVNGGQFMF